MDDDNDLQLSLPFPDPPPDPPEQPPTAEIIDFDDYRRQRLIERLGLIRYCPPLYG